tara:strand:+ start:203 stop:478 length:276 start_codon:yes stop_codon:yes gene_type:complete
MALTKEEKYDKIEVVGDYKALQLRKKIIVKDDGTVISTANHRVALNCGSLDPDDSSWIDTDISAYPQEVKDIAAVVWTQAIKDAWKTKLEG